MLIPALTRADEPGAAAGDVDGVLKLFPLPRAARLLRARAIVAGAKHAHRGVAMVRKIAVDADPAVAQGIEAAERVPGRRRRLAVHAQIARAAQRDGGGARVDANLLGRSRTG